MIDQKYLDKAEVLVEALPYIQRFNRKIIVVKYGGSAMIDEGLRQDVISDVVLLKLVGFKPVIVHGGGKEISRWVDKVGMDTKFVEGLRVTDDETMELAEMVLSRVNKDLVSRVQSLGVKAVGVSGKDGGLLKVQKVTPNGQDIGHVGEVVDVDTKLIMDLLEKDFLPIIFPIGMDENFETYNVNADEAAGALAQALEAEKLVFLSDVEGVRVGEGDNQKVVPELYIEEAKSLIEDGTINGGMIPKVMNCIDAIQNGVSRVHIMDGRIPHSILVEIFTNKGCGTVIMNEGDEKFWREEEL